MRPVKIEFDVGQTRYGQRLTLILERDSAGALGWTFLQDAANQRDDRQRISGIATETLKQMAEAIGEAEKLSGRKL